MDIVQAYLSEKFDSLLEKEVDLKTSIAEAEINLEHIKTKISEYESLQPDEDVFFASSSHIQDKTFKSIEADNLKKTLDDLIHENNLREEELLSLVEDKKKLKNVLDVYNKEKESILDSQLLVDNILGVREDVDECIDKIEFARKLLPQDTKRAGMELDKAVKELKKLDRTLEKYT